MSIKEGEENLEDKKSSEGETKVVKDKELKPEAQKRYEDDIIKWKSEYKVAKEELETTKVKSENEKTELASKIEATAKEKQMFEQKYIDSEIKAQAVAAGIKDIELVQLVPKGDIKLDEKGNVIGVEKAIADLKTRKPEWFGSEKKISSSSNSEIPEKGGKNKTDARTMTKDDWNKNRSRYMGGRF
jgi:hypothetical protein